MSYNYMNVFIKILTFASVTFSLTLILLFQYLNSLQSHYFIDEKFHIPQTLKYCKGQFFEWDSKITTLPGLYLFSAFLLGPLNLCTTTNLRLINALCTYLNLFLSYRIIECLRERESKERVNSNLSSYKLYLTAWNITFFPPLFFWFFLYYTDVLSVNLTLMMFLLHLYDKNKRAAFVGILSICVRQTNAVWVAFLGIDKCLTSIDNITKKPHFTNTLNLFPCVKILYKIFQAERKHGILSLLKFLQSTCKRIAPYTLALASFVIFTIYNRGIVVGDRTAHVPTIHLTQIFYYSLFVLCFSWPYLLPYLDKFLRLAYKNSLSTSLAFLCLICIIRYNTLVHPYILADNRHYSFYVWKNFMNRFVIFKYSLAPAYAFAMYAIIKSLGHLRLLSLAAYILCTSIVLIPQLLLEPRYFIIPYVLFRLHQKEPKNWQIVAETLTTILTNVAQFLLFINKTFYWEDEKYPQRIGW